MSWEYKMLGDVCEIKSGGTPSRKIEENFGGNIPWVKITDIENAKNGYLKNTEEKITEKGLSDIRNRIFPKDTLLFAMYGSVGKVAFLNRPMAINQAILGINPKDDECIDLKYLKYWFNFKQKELLSKARGVTLKNLSATIVKNLQIPLPPLSTQKKIATILDKAQALIDNDKKVLEKYDQLAQSVFLEMFGDPVRNEKGWEVIKIGELTKVSSGSTPSRKIKEYYQGSIPWVKTMEVIGNEIYNTTEKITEKAKENTHLKLYPKNSILVAMYGQGKTRGQVGFLQIEATTNQACAVIEPNSNYNGKFLFELLKHSYTNLRDLSRGGNQPNLNVGMIKSYPVIFPPKKEQDRFEQTIDKIYEQKDNTQLSLQKTEELFNRLLQKAFKGELVE